MNLRSIILILASLTAVWTASDVAFGIENEFSQRTCRLAYSAELPVLTVATSREKDAVRDFILRQRRDLGFDPANGADGRSLVSDLSNFERHYEGSRGRIFLLKEAGQIVGTAAMTRIDKDTAEIKKVYLDAGLRGRGAGRELVEVVIAEASRQGYRRIILQTRPQMAKAVGLYEKLGFVKNEMLSSGLVLFYELSLTNTFLPNTVDELVGQVQVGTVRIH